MIDEDQPRSLVLEDDCVNGDPVLARKVLLDTGEEGVREIEARDPEHCRRPVLDPAAHHLHLLDEVVDVGGQWLLAGV